MTDGLTYLLDRLSEVTRAATPGPWCVHPIKGHCDDEIHTRHEDYQQWPHGGYIGTTSHAAGHQCQKFQHDSRFIALTDPEVVGAMIEVVRYADAVLEADERGQGTTYGEAMTGLALARKHLAVVLEEKEK